MEKIRVEIKRLHPNAKVPVYAHVGEWGDIAADLFSLVGANILPNSVQVIQTGIAISPPSNYGAIIEARSGLSQLGITILGGVIDSGYRGEIKVALGNISAKSIPIEEGERIAQIRFVKRVEADFIDVVKLPESNRGDAGFGSTGKL